MSVAAGGAESSAAVALAASVLDAAPESEAAESVGAGASDAALSVAVESSVVVEASVAVESSAEAVADGSLMVELSEAVTDGSLRVELSALPSLKVLASVPLVKSGVQEQEETSGVVPKGQVPSVKTNQS